MIDKICDLDKCTGCSACMNVCPTGAITMVPGKIGHIYPSISDKCIECTKCIKTCPVNIPVELVKPFHTFAARVKDDNEHSTSTSGGAAACFTNKMLTEGGIVYGCASIPKGEVRHIRVTNQDEAKQLKGSKYVHSHINDTFKQIKNDLKEDKRVLFVGTPCQVAGLKNYIGKIGKNLITVDLICHGVPSQEVLLKHLAAQGINSNDIDNIGFREGTNYYLSVIKDGKTIYRKRDTQDLYYMAFNDNLTFRDSCFTCRYSSPNRCSDITIGDFWGLGAKEPFIQDTHKMSVILINTDKGLAFLNTCRDDMVLVERSLEEAVTGNHNLNKPSVSVKAPKFKHLYETTDIESALKKCLLKRRIKAPLIPIIQWILAHK